MAITLIDLVTRISYESNRTNLQEYGNGINYAILSSIKYLEYNHPWLFEKQVPLQPSSIVYNLASNPITTFNGTNVVFINVGGNTAAFANSAYVQLTGVTDPSGMIGGIPIAYFNSTFPIVGFSGDNIIVNLTQNATSNATSGGSTVMISGSTNIIPLPADFNGVIAFNYVRGYQVFGLREGFQGITYAELSDYYALVTSSGQPMKWALFNNNIFIYPNLSPTPLPPNPPVPSIVFNLIYNYKDILYPDPIMYLSNGSPNPNYNPDYISQWFDLNTIDMCRYKALEIYYRDTLQSPEIAQAHAAAFHDLQKNVISRNNYRSVSNLLII